MPLPPGTTTWTQRPCGERGGAQEVTTSFLGVLMVSKGHGDSEESWTRPRPTSLTGTRHQFAGGRNTPLPGRSVSYPGQSDTPPHFHRVECRLTTWGLLCPLSGDGTVRGACACCPRSTAANAILAGPGPARGGILRDGKLPLQRSQLSLNWCRPRARLRVIHYPRDCRQCESASKLPISMNET